MRTHGVRLHNMKTMPAHNMKKHRSSMSEINSIGSVSYTHLDVYKRQACCRAGFGSAFDVRLKIRLKSCAGGKSNIMCISAAAK